MDNFLKLVKNIFFPDSPVFIRWIERNIGRPDALISYKGVEWRGSCTVFHNSETGKRASTDTEWVLSQVCNTEKWKLEDKR